MKLSSFESIVQALNAGQVRYLIVGGIAVNIYGYSRTTYDVDLVIQLTPENVSAAFVALATLDYHPVLPITAEQFGNPAVRKSWREDKGMVVMNMWSERHRDTPLDIFVDEPFDFNQEYASASFEELSPGLLTPLIRLETLFAMKRLAARPKDLADLDELNLLYQKPNSYE